MYFRYNVKVDSSLVGKCDEYTYHYEETKPTDHADDPDRFHLDMGNFTFNILM